MHFCLGKSNVTTRVALVGQHGTTHRSSRRARHARHDRRDTCSGASPLHGVGWTCHTFSGSCSWDRCKSRAYKTKLVHASTTASSSSAMLEQARLDTLVTTHTTRRTSIGLVTVTLDFFNDRLDPVCAWLPRANAGDWWQTHVNAKTCEVLKAPCSHRHNFVSNKLLTYTALYHQGRL